MNRMADDQVIEKIETALQYVGNLRSTVAIHMGLARTITSQPVPDAAEYLDQQVKVINTLLRDAVAGLKG